MSQNESKGSEGKLPTFINAPSTPLEERERIVAYGTFGKSRLMEKWVEALRAGDETNAERIMCFVVAIDEFLQDINHGCHLEDTWEISSS